MNRWMRAACRWLGICLVGAFFWGAHLRAESPEAEVRTAVEHYFKSWSDQDMAAYQACFHPDAIVFFKTEDDRLIRTMLAPFIESQRLAHASSPSPMKETPVKIEIDTAKTFASALVHWELAKGGAVERGVDVFTLVKGKDGWKIGSLVFGEEN